MNSYTIQIQAVIYNNEKDSLIKAIEHIHNALRVEKQKTNNISHVKFIYGDASASPIFSQTDIIALNKQYGDLLEIEYRFFNFNSGFGKGQNLLGESCTADYMLVMNPDIIVNPRFFIEMMKPFSDEKVGIVEARQTPIEHHKAYDFETFETEWAAMACVMIPTKVWNQLNGIDSDTFFMYCEDVDFSWRARLNGYKVIYQPLAPVYHAKRISNNAEWKPTKTEVYCSAESALLMAYKWSNEQRVQELLNYFRNGEDFHREIVAGFETKKRENRLPTPLDPNHEVATFTDGYYAKNRFTW